MRSEAHSGYMAHVTVEDKRNTDTKRNVLCNTKETLVLGYIEKKNLEVWSDFSFSCYKQGLFIESKCALDPV